MGTVHIHSQFISPFLTVSDHCIWRHNTVQTDVINISTDPVQNVFSNSTNTNVAKIRNF